MIHHVYNHVQLIDLLIALILDKFQMNVDVIDHELEISVQKSNEVIFKLS
jgi:hypothetical protein